MKRVVISQPLEVGIEEAEEPQPGPGEILIRTLITGISAGTEMNLYRGTNPDLVRRRWGEEFVYPMMPLGSPGDVEAMDDLLPGMATMYGMSYFSSGICFAKPSLTPSSRRTARRLRSAASAT